MESGMLGAEKPGGALLDKIEFFQGRVLQNSDIWFIFENLI
jgi:hypothetical protein